MEDENKKRLHIHEIAARYKKDIKYTWEELKNILVKENSKDMKEAAKRKENGKSK